MVCDGLREELPQLYPDFFNRNSELFDADRKSDKIDVQQRKKATMNRFGYEWLHFPDYNCDNFEPFTAPLPSGFFKGKLGLDIGCGAGRHALQASQRGAEIIAIDLSQAVDAAQHNYCLNKRVHVVQADIYNLPIKTGIFDFIYSLGVLHHLPEPENGYRDLIPFLKEGGALFIWLYAYSFRKIILEILRAAAQKMSNHNIRRMAFLCNLIDYGIFINIFRFTQKVPLLRKWTEKYAPLRVAEYAKHGYRISYTDWFDRLSAPITNYYKENEMKLWLNRSRLCNTRLLPEGDSWWWLYGERKAEL
jgi:SAM-dependent methyltransferase